MATGKYCDVRGEGFTARTYHITIDDLDADDVPPIRFDITKDKVLDVTKDLCPDALARLLGLIQKGCSKPAKRKAAADGK